MALGRRADDELRARRRARAVDANLDLAARPRARRAGRALRRGRRAGPAAVAGPPAAVGLRPRRPHARPPARRARWSTCSATTRASCCGARTTRRSRRPRTGRAVVARRAGEARGDDVPARRGARTCSTARSRARSRRRDHTRPVVRHSGVLPGLAEPGTDTHLYFGWYHGDLARPRARTCGAGRASAASCPSSARRRFPTPPSGWSRNAGPTSTGNASPRHHALQRDVVRPARAPDRREVVRRVARRRPRRTRPRCSSCRSRTCAGCKYAPTGGFAMFSLADPHPLVELVGARPRPRAQARLRRACATRAGRCSPMVEPRAGLVHVVNDTRDDLFATSRSRSSVDGRVTRWPGDVAGRRHRVRRPRRARRRGRRRSRPRTPDASAASSNRYPLLVLEAGRRARLTRRCQRRGT